MAEIGNFKPFSLLVTGAPGWLCDALLPRLGETLPALTRVRCLVQSILSAERIKEWRGKHPTVTEILPGDLLQEATLESACANMRGGVLLHAAAIFHPQRPADWFAVNRDGTLKLAATAKKAGIKRFVFISSTAAQGASAANVLLTEEMACHPFSTYGRSKHEAEEGLLRLHQAGVFEVVILRPSQFYGPPMPASHVDFFKRIQRGQAQLTGGGCYTRSLSYIADLVDGVISCFTHPKASGEVFNLCDAQSYTEREVVEAAAEALGMKVQISTLPTMAAQAASLANRALNHFERYSPGLRVISESYRHSGASSQKAQQLLGYAPKIKVREGMKRTVQWCREHNLLD